MKKIINSPKTSLGALVILVSTGLLIAGKLDTQNFLAILGVAGAWIGLTAQDATKPQS